MSAPTAVPNDRIRDHAERARDRPGDARCALDGVRGEQRVVGRGPRRRAFVLPADARGHRSASSSVHINQFGFRPGVVGDRFAEVLVAKAARGPGAARRRPPGPTPSAAAGVLRAAHRGGCRGLRRARDEASRRRSARSADGGATRWNLRGLGHIDHRKVVVVDGRIGWVGGAGIEDHFEDGRFHDLFLRVTGPVVQQLQLVFLGGFRWLGGRCRSAELDALFPAPDDERRGDSRRRPAQRPGRYRPITDAIARVLEGARETLDVVNPYVTDRGMIRRIEQAARRGVRVRLFVPANANNWACAAAQQFHHATLLDAGCASSSTRRCSTRRRSCATARSCSRDAQREAWSLKRFIEITSAPSTASRAVRGAVSARRGASSPGCLTGRRERAWSAFEPISPLIRAALRLRCASAPRSSL